MPLINVTDIQTGDNADASLWNSRYAIIVNLLNGNLDADNISNGAISAAKLASGSVTSDKQGDTGWKDLPVTNPAIYTGDVQYRRIGDVVYLRGTVTATSNLASGNHPLALFPNEAIPYTGGTASINILLAGAGSSVTKFGIYSDGTTPVLNSDPSATTKSLIFDGHSYLANS